MSDRHETIAHVRKSSAGEWVLHSLEGHCRSVAKLASDFASPFGGSDWAHLAGLWHDLGAKLSFFEA